VLGGLGSLIVRINQLGIRLRPGNGRHDDRQLPGCRGRKSSIHLPCAFHFEKPTPFWAGRANGLIIPKHLFEAHKGANSREAPANVKPMRTGPHQFVDFAPGDLVKGERIHSTIHLTGRISIRSN